MKLITNIKDRLRGFLDTITRFPLTILLLVGAVIINAILINSSVSHSLEKLLMALFFGALLATVMQLGYERFFGTTLIRLIAGGITLIASAVYYLLIRGSEEGIELMLRLTIIYFLLLIAFLWIPVIRSRIDFNQSFMVVFKGLFSTGFFTGILFLGIILIYRTIDMLIIRIGGHPYEHTANIIFLLLAPIYFLSLIPVYPGKTKDEDSAKEEYLVKATSPARFLETLISYIVIPITVAFTIILLLYIAINIRGEFWTNSLMEPLLISYTITVIVVYLLASRMSNTFAKYFRLIFPKVLIPVVLFQTVSSIIRGMSNGITYGRYYVILFGLFAIITGGLFCILPVRRNGVIAPILIILALISIIPPCDAFSLSRFSQLHRLENTLHRNQMLQGDKITPKSELSKKDQEIIIASVNYLDSMGYTENITWLSDYHENGNFTKTFGFEQFATDKSSYRNVSVTRKDDTLLPISGYDYLVRMDLNSEGQRPGYEYKKDGVSYQITVDYNAEKIPVILLRAENKEILRFDTSELFNKFTVSESSSYDTATLTFTQENESAAITVIAQSISINESESGMFRYADVYVLVDIKG